MRPQPVKSAQQSELPLYTLAQKRLRPRRGRCHGPFRLPGPASSAGGLRVETSTPVVARAGSRNLGEVAGAPRDEGAGGV